MSVNDRIRDLEIRHQVGVQRLSSGVLRQLIRILDDADAEIVGKLLARGATLEGSFTSVRLEKLLDTPRVINHDAHVKAGRDLRKELLAVAGYENQYQQRLIQSALPIRWDLVSPSAEMLNAAVTARPFQGRLLKEWEAELHQAKAELIENEQWVSTLDTRTCSHCMGLDGQKFELGKRGSTDPGAHRLPLHQNAGHAVLA